MPATDDLGLEHWIPYITGRQDPRAGWVIRVAADQDNTKVTFKVTGNVKVKVFAKVNS